MTPNRTHPTGPESPAAINPSPSPASPSAHARVPPVTAAKVALDSTCESNVVCADLAGVRGVADAKTVSASDKSSVRLITFLIFTSTFMVFLFG